MAITRSLQTSLATSCFLTLIASNIAYAQNQPQTGQNQRRLYGAAAQEIDNSLRVGIAWTDNINQTPSDEVEETIAVADLALNTQHTIRRLTARVLGSVGFRHYLSNDFEDEVVGNILGGVDLDLVPNVATWSLENFFGTLEIDPFRPNAPSNRENVNQFSTGPDLRLPLGSRAGVALGGRYRSNTFEEQELDNEVLGATAALFWATSGRGQIALNYDFEEIEYDDTNVAGGDYDRSSLFLSLSTQGSRTEFNIEVGGNRIEFGQDSFEGFYGLLGVTRDITARSFFSLNFQQRYSDSGDLLFGFLDTGALVGGDIAFRASSGDPLQSVSLQVALNHVRDTAGWYVGASYDDEDYVTINELDRRWYSVFAGFNKNFGAGWELRIGAQANRFEFLATGRDDDRFFLQAALAKRLTRNFEVEVRISHDDQQSADVTQDFRETRASLTFGYSPAQR